METLTKKTAVTNTSSATDAHLVRIGKTKKKHLKKFKKGHGRITTEVKQIVDTKVNALPPLPEGKQYQPVVIVFEEVLSKKEKKKRKKKARRRARRGYGIWGSSN